MPPRDQRPQKRGTPQKGAAPKAGGARKPASSGRPGAARSSAPKRGDSARSGAPKRGDSTRSGAPKRGDSSRSSGGPKRDGRPPRRDGKPFRRREEPELEGPKEWGGLARKATGRLREGGLSKASAAFQEAASLDRPTKSDEWVHVGEVRDEAAAAVGRGKRPVRPPAPKPEQIRRKTTPAVAEELTKAAGAAQAPKLGQRLAEATKAFERERYPEAKQILKTLADRAPGSPAVRELYGLTLYRLGQWKLAERELEAFATMTGSTEQHPVLADCARALRHWNRVDELWEELRAASPGADLVTEGRIVAAGALADRGKLREAIALLEQGAGSAKRLKEHHLRLLYALGDLRERAGEIPAARTLFRRVLDTDPTFADTADRLRALR